MCCKLTTMLIMGGKTACGAANKIAQKIKTKKLNGCANTIRSTTTEKKKHFF